MGDSLCVIPISVYICTRNRHLDTSTMRRKTALYAFLLTLLTLLQGCTSSPLERLGGIDSLINTRPDSALTLLNTLLPDTNAMSKGDLMRYYLLRTNAQNKCDTVFRAEHAALMRRVCDYYDHRSSKREANNKMLAHYLLGRCYDDMGEAPAALQEFHRAIEATDSMRIDNLTLSRIYGQISTLFYKQNLPYYQLDALNQARENALAAHDSISAIVYLEWKSEALYMINLVDSSITVQKEVYKEYMNKGLRSYAALSVGSLIRKMVESKRIQEASFFINIFESESGVYNQGKVAKGHEIYHYIKGLYYLETHQTDSAETEFRKLLNDNTSPNDQEAAYHGLVLLYRLCYKTDSVAKYSYLAYQIGNENQRTKFKEDILRSQSLFEYGRYQALALQRAKEARAAQYQRNFIIAVSSIVIFLIIILSLMAWNTKRTQLKMQNERHKNDLLSLRQNQLELERIKDNKYQELISEKEQLISVLNSRIKSYHYGGVKSKSSVEKELKSLPQRIEMIKMASIPGNIPTMMQWEELEKQVDKVIPDFTVTLSSTCGHLSIEEWRICLLVRLYFEPFQIVNLLNISNQRVSNLRRQLLQKVFGQEGKAKEFDKKLCQMR